jgi:hypothetical protein
MIKNFQFFSLLNTKKLSVSSALKTQKSFFGNGGYSA